MEFSTTPSPSVNVIQKAQFLLEQQRHGDAENLLREGLGRDPENPLLMVMLAVALLGRELPGAAEAALLSALDLDAEMPYAYYVLSLVQLHRGESDAALNSIIKAISLDPVAPEFYALRASIQLEKGQWQLAEESARRGLALNPRHVGCLNVLGMALNASGQPESAETVMRSALSHNPLHAESHANFGWTQLRANQPRAALASFQEALRINPNSENARTGLLQALNARNPLYRMLLRYFFSMTGLTLRRRWILVLVALGLVQLLWAVQKISPVLAPWALGALVFYGLFLILSWSGGELFNLTLMFHPLGKHALSREERRLSLVIGLLFLGGVLLTGAGLWWEHYALTLSGIGLVMMMMPVSGASRVTRPGKRRVLGFLLGLAALLWTVGLAAGILISDQAISGVYVPFLTLFLAVMWLNSLWNG
ncbi:MAG TPA: tetratricopeptide repeat protein [Calditrichia bacterium]|nr:tetratricopeptide repeat protein [Calditrichota bacterium]HQU70834.1 tetratricopeptide repeat protein [Calditrichia bacterium]HQV33984.1 tetratricopeptide repeat protein [Calditrichia bacterium]